MLRRLDFCLGAKLIFKAAVIARHFWNLVWCVWTTRKLIYKIPAIVWIVESFVRRQLLVSSEMWTQIIVYNLKLSITLYEFGRWKLDWRLIIKCLVTESNIFMILFVIYLKKCSIIESNNCMILFVINWSLPRLFTREK